MVTAPQATVIGDTEANAATAVGDTVITLDVVNGEPQIVVVQVSVTGPPQAPGMVLKVEVTVPLIFNIPT